MQELSATPTLDDSDAAANRATLLCNDPFRGVSSLRKTNFSELSTITLTFARIIPENYATGTAALHEGAGPQEPFLMFPSRTTNFEFDMQSCALCRQADVVPPCDERARSLSTSVSAQPSFIPADVSAFLRCVRSRGMLKSVVRQGSGA